MLRCGAVHGAGQGRGVGEAVSMMPFGEDERPGPDILSGIQEQVKDP
ncbi:MAG: hypothetical protein IJR14_04330 [Synergistaceae bacterium]|nr:hypothetical protein [Synergistaceae bacterium]